MMVMRVWQQAGLMPHRFERYMASDDPDFETMRQLLLVLATLSPAIPAAVLQRPLGLQNGSQTRSANGAWPRPRRRQSLTGIVQSLANRCMGQ